MGRDGRDRDLVLPPDTFAYVLDNTKGRVSVSVGPNKVSFSNTEQPIVWDAAERRFIDVQDPRQAVQVFPMAPEGHYIVLNNPADEGKHPAKGLATDSVDLHVGRKVNIAGPVSFPLWPGQTAKTIEGHHLRHNQYLIVRVYDEQQARQNWRSAVVKPQVTSPAPAAASADGSSSDAPAPEAPPVSATAEEAPDLTMGQLMLVQGTDVSFYIPPTGIEVVPERGEQFAREAVTLERLEYCILLDENGEKRYMQGPAVVFPKPTEKFVESDERNRKFRAIELNDQSGLYVKVIAEYAEGEKVHKVGDELFITGREQAIYFPRPEHSIIEYDGRQKHHAIAVPAGEGRYVLDRNQGTVDLVKGPKMFLPDPRTQVVVLRILDPHTVDLLYPGNREAQAINDQYRQMSGGLSPGEHLTSSESARAARFLAARGGDRTPSEEFAGDAFHRGTSYTPPRTITLNTKYEGAVAVDIWPGYAVLVTKKTGERRVEMGPKMVLLEYDEMLMSLELSTGRPKNDARLFHTAYLRVMNNQVGDIVTVETRDLVKVSVEVSYRVNFEGSTPEEMQQWFGVENYVKVLTDHGRSRMRNAAKRHGIQEFYTNTIDLIRDVILGKSQEDGVGRTGLVFGENGMRVYDVEVLNVSIEDRDVAELLIDAQERALSGAIRLSAAEEEAMRTERLEELKRKGIEEEQKTAEMEAGVAKDKIRRALDQRMAQATADLAVAEENRKASNLVLEIELATAEQRIELARKDAAQEMERMRLETEEIVKRVGAMSDDLVTALQMFGDKVFIEKLVEGVGPVALATGVTTADIFSQIFKGTPFEGMMSALAERPLRALPGGRAAAE
jgi:major vault protein